MDRGRREVLGRHRAGVFDLQRLADRDRCPIGRKPLDSHEEMMGPHPAEPSLGAQHLQPPSPALLKQHTSGSSDANSPASGAIFVTLRLGMALRFSDAILTAHTLSQPRAPAPATGASDAVCFFSSKAQSRQVAPDDRHSCEGDRLGGRVRDNCRGGRAVTPGPARATRNAKRHAIRLLAGDVMLGFDQRGPKAPSAALRSRHY